MNKTIVVGAIGLLLLSAIGVSFSDSERWGNRGEPRSDDQDETHYWQADWWQGEGRDVTPVRSDLYREECGVCHFAYQPGLLPARSWERVMGSLERHFGDNAALPGPQISEIQAYLLHNAADAVESRYSRGLRGSLGEDALPERITDTLYFRRQHHEIPPRLVQNNAQVSSFGNCQVCHREADRGSYDEHAVWIPGFGRWDD